MGVDFTVIRFVGYCIPINELGDFSDACKNITYSNKKLFIRRQDCYGNDGGDAYLALGRKRHLEILNTMVVGYDKRGLSGCTKTHSCIPLSPYHAEEINLYDGYIESVEKYITVPYKFRKYFREWIFTYFH
jgi:hypothetical protein